MTHLLQTLDQTQWWSTGQLRTHQDRQIDGLMSWARTHVRHYRQSLKGLSAAQWHDVPVLTRRQLQDRTRALQSDTVPDSHGRTGWISTSGSTGTPVRVRRTDLTTAIWRAMTARDHLWHRRDVRRDLAVIRRLTDRGLEPDGITSAQWGGMEGLLGITGRLRALEVSTPLRDQLAWLAKDSPAYLQTYPTNIAALARVALHEAVSLPGLLAVSTLSEALEPDTRQVVHQAFGVDIQDMYSVQEVGYLALQCPYYPHLHVQSETVRVEVLDRDDHPCEPGQVGRVVVTALHNYAMPLIRYDIGDLAEVGGPCPCGRGLPVLTRVWGRSRNMLVTPSGERMWPSLGTSSISQLAPIITLQAVQTRLDHVDLRVVTRRALTEPESEAVAAHLAHRLPDGIGVTVVPVDRIDRSASGKFEDFVCALSPEDQTASPTNPTLR